MIDLLSARFPAAEFPALNKTAVRTEIRTVAAVSAAFLLVRLWIAAVIDAGFDEALYFAYSLRPAWSYFDHPPMVAWLAGLVPRLTGVVTPFAVRLPSVLLFTATGLLLYVLARRWLTEREGIFALVLFNTVPVLFICGGIFVLPDGGLCFFWTAALLVFARILFDNDHRRRRWILAGVLAGLAMLSKYHGVFLITFFIIYLYIDQPRIFKTLNAYLFCFFAGLTFLPVVVWNLRHDFASFTYQGRRALGGGISVDDFLQALAGQAGYLTPMVFLPMAYVIWRTLARGIRGGDREYRFHFFFGGLPVLFFMGISLFKPILPHWTLPGYIVLIIPLARLVADGYRRKVWVRRTVIASGVFIGVMVLLAVAHIRYGVLQLHRLAERGWISESAVSGDPTLDMVGWDAVSRYLESNRISPESAFLFTPKFLISGKVDLAVKGRYAVMCFQKDANAYAVWDSRLNMQGKDAVFICTDRYFLDPNAAYGNYFESISGPDVITVKRGGTACKRYYFYRCRNLLRPYPNPFIVAGSG